MQNLLTIDVEDYFQVENFKKVVKFSDWPRYESRVERNTAKVLDILARRDTKATFFVLGWIAEQFPALVKRIHQAGHEIASHGYAHQLIYQQTPEEFRKDLRKAKRILEDIIQESVLGYRAPAYSITEKSLWALDILLKEGFRYDSSLFPIRHDRGGLRGANRYPHRIFSAKKQDCFVPLASLGVLAMTGKRRPPRNDEKRGRPPRNDGIKKDYLWELPLSTTRILAQNIPFSGGGYFRLLPYRFVQRSIKTLNKQGYPAILYLHPWELDPEQPRIKVDYLSRFRHYLNLAKTEEKLNRLLSDFNFMRIKDFLGYEKPL